MRGMREKVILHIFAEELNRRFHDSIAELVIYDGRIFRGDGKVVLFGLQPSKCTVYSDPI
jgi:hypothetical protein